MAFAIIAEFPLGTYRARRPDGSRDDLPSPTRLHAALLAAAGQGARAVANGEQLEPREADRAALEWLETHPPSAMHCPPLRHDARSVTAHRAEGFFGLRKGKSTLVTREDPSGAVAVGGPIAWLWDTPPPVEILAALDELCSDAAYLGTTECPVRLRTGEAVSTHRLDPEASLLGGVGLDVDVPRPGRTAALEKAFRALRAREPSVKEDDQRKDERAVSEQPERASTSLARYTALTPSTSPVPWPTVVAIPVDRVIPPDRRLGWCVALHRALVARIGDGAPALVTGHYEPGVRLPANRLAIQYVRQAAPSAPPLGAAAAFLLLLPAGADPGDLAVIDRAVRSLRDVRHGAGRPIRLGPMKVTDGGAFWRPVPAGHTRLWVTATPAIPESRPLRGRTWTLGDAALLSLGLVFRDRYPVAGMSRSSAYGALVDAIAASGARIVEAHKVNDGRVGRFVHRTNGQSAVQPYRAAMALDGLQSDRTLLAIGQSRHLGGGLLAPLDLREPAPSGALRGIT